MAITIQKSVGDYLIVRFPYSREAIEKIRQIKGRKWHPEEKFWTVPADKNTEMKIRQLFSCEQLNFIVSEYGTKQEILSNMAPKPEAGLGIHPQR